MKTLALLIPLGLVGALFLASVMFASPEPRFAQERPIPAPILARYVPDPTAAAAASLPQAAASLPRPAASLPWKALEVSPLAAQPRRAPASLPTVVPTPVPEPTPTATAEPDAADREGCDPAYPDERTCIPPGPPFGQGCAITDERLFTVLPPDPQRLDHDKDGIGCEPI
jgi:hypothetical protein